MINRAHELSLTRQAEVLALARASLYYRPVPMSEADLRLMRRIDELHLEWPFCGSRLLRDLLVGEGLEVGRKHVASLMRKMGIEALYQRRNTSRRHPQHPVFPYLLRGLAIDRANQVWEADITYIPMARGFVYLFAVIDWFSRKILAWRISNSLTADFCVEAVEEAIARYGTPEIFNTDQGSQFSSAAFIELLRENSIRISMDGRGAWRDNVFVERLWRSIKYEEVYLHAYASVSDAKRPASPAMSRSTTRVVRTKLLTARRPITCTSNPCRSRRLLNPRSSTYPGRENCLNPWGHLSLLMDFPSRFRLKLHTLNLGTSMPPRDGEVPYIR